MIRFLQLLVGGIHDAIESHYQDGVYSQAVAFACFGIFQNIGAFIILAASVVERFTEGDHFFLPSKVVWIIVMVLVIIALLALKDRIMAEDRIRFSSKLRRRLFLISYFALSFVAVIASYAAIPVSP